MSWLTTLSSHSPLSKFIVISSNPATIVEVRPEGIFLDLEYEPDVIEFLSQFMVFIGPQRAEYEGSVDDWIANFTAYLVENQIEYKLIQPDDD